MSKHRRDPQDVADKENGSSSPHHQKRSRKQRLTAWLIGLAGVGTAAFITAFSTTIGNHVAALTTQPAPPGGLPVLVDYAGMGHATNPERTVEVLPGRAVLNSQQLNELYADPGDWFPRYNAVDTEEINIQLVIQGNRSHAVRIIDLEPDARCTRPLHGTLFFSPSAGGDPVTQLSMNLDKPQLPPAYITSTSVNNTVINKSTSNYFGHYNVSLNYGEQFTFDIAASTKLHYCQFSLKMTVVDGTRTVTESINDNGKPFRVTGVYGHLAEPVFSQYSIVYLGGIANSITGDSRWVRVSPARAAQVYH